MVKILFISHNLNRGGGQLLLKSIIQGMANKKSSGDKKDIDSKKEGIDKTNFDCHIWSPVDGELKYDYESSGIPVYIQDFEIDRINREQKIEFDNLTRKTINKIISEHKINKKKLAIRCAGTVTTKLLNEFDFSEIDIVGIFDNNQALVGSDIRGCKIYSAEEINKFQIDSILIAHLQPKFFKKELKSKNSKIYDIFTDSKIKKFKKISLSLLNFVKPAVFFAKINPDIVFVNNAANFWAVIAGKLLGKKVIWVIHESFNPETFRAFPQFLYLLSFKLADKFVFPSKAAYSFYNKVVPQHKTKIIHGGIDNKLVDEYKSAELAFNTRKELNIPENHKVISVIGTVEEVKGQVYFVKAAINLLKLSASKDFTFVIVGSKNDEYADNIKAIIKNSGYEDNFKLVPITKEAYKYFNITDIYVCSSVKDSFPLVLLEAMAFEKPIIATNICGIPEAVLHNQTGILISIENMEDNIVRSIELFLKNPDLMTKFSKNAYARFLENFTLEKMLEKYILLISSV